MAKCLHILGDVDVRCDDLAAPRKISVQFVCGTHFDDGQAAAGMRSLNLNDEVANYVVPEEEECLVYRQSLVVDGKDYCVIMRTPVEGQKTVLVKNASPALSGSSGINLQPPFFPEKIRVNTSTGLLTILPSSSSASLSDIPRSMPSTVGQPQTPAFRKLIPGMNVAFIAFNGKAVCAENWGRGRLKASRMVVSAWETFSVVKGNGSDDGIGLRSGANGKYVTYAGSGGSLVASRSSVLSKECFVEVDAGDGKVALLAVDNDKYVGGGPDLSLVPWLKECEMFVVKPVVHAW